ncbi:Uncharacterized protein SCF082_LOCUS47960, partial [Durusdinium trenchii]
MPKRKTSMPEPKAKAKAKASPSLPAIPPDSAKLPHMKLLNEWDEVLREHGALDLYLNKMLDTKDSRQVVVTENCANCARSQEKCIEFYNFIEEKYPPDVQRCLVQLIGLNGFLTNPDLPGTEKLVICTVDEKWLSVRRVWVSAAELALASGEKLISPQSVFTVKGFNRSVCALLVLMATMEMPALMEAGVTLTSVIRRRPNCFNLLHQMEILMRDGCTTESAVEGLEALDSASSVAAAYSVGRTEAGAATNLLKSVSASTRNQLKELEQLQRTCSIFLACLAMFGASVPTGYMAEVKDEIMSTFVNRHADADLMNLVQTSAPPCDLSKIDLFKNHLGKFQKKVDDESVKKAAELEAALLQTTWSQTELTIQSDINALRGWADKFKLFANQQGWLDLQYLASRYENGKKAVADYMARRHTFGAFKNLMLSQGEIVSKQAALGKSVQQRGVDATGEVVNKLLEGLSLQDSQPVLIVDCLPNRIPDMIKNKYLASHAAQLKAVEEELAKDRNVAAALKGSAGELPGPEPAPSPTGSTVPTPAPARTVATPDYEGCAVPSFDKRVDVSPKPMEEFTTGRTLHCKAALQNSQMHVGKDRNDESFWINETGENESISARELFGFNVGSFNELTTGFDG